MRFLALLCSLMASQALAGGKEFVPGYTLINAVSMAGDITSATIDARYYDHVDIELVATGTPTGSFFVDCSLNQPMPPAVAAPTWIAISLSPAPAVTGAASNIMIELLPTGCLFLRVRYVAGSGSGTLTAYVSEKQI